MAAMAQQEAWAKRWPLHHAALAGKGAPQLLERLLGTAGSLTEADRYAGRKALSDDERRLMLDAKEAHTGRTALHFAVDKPDMTKEGSTRAAQTLLEHGADVFALDNDGHTPLDLALLPRDWEYDSGRVQAVSMLRTAVESAWAKGRRPTPWSARYPWDSGYKEHHPLHEACCRDDMIAGERMLGPAPRDLNSSLSPPQTPRALDEELEPPSEAVDQLEARDAYGHTPLLVAAGNGSYRAATLLLKRGADITVKDANGKTAVDLARVNNNTEMVELLQDRDGLGGSSSSSHGHGQDQDQGDDTEQKTVSPAVPKAAEEAEEDDGIESEEEDPIAAAIARATAAVARADAADGGTTVAAPTVAAATAAGAAGFMVAAAVAAAAAAGASSGPTLNTGVVWGDGTGSTVKTDARAEGENAPAHADKSHMAKGVTQPGEQPGSIDQVADYAAMARKKRASLVHSEDGGGGGGGGGLGSFASGGRKARGNAVDKVAQADQAVEAHLQKLENKREAARWDAEKEVMVEEEPEFGTLRIVAAVDVPKADTYSDNDLYAVIIWNDKVLGRTRCIRDENSPKWDESFDLRVYPCTNTLRIELYERDKFPGLGGGGGGGDESLSTVALDIEGRGDQFMGQVLLEGAAASKLPQQETELELQEKGSSSSSDDKNGKGGGRGGGMKGGYSMRGAAAGADESKRNGGSGSGSGSGSKGAMIIRYVPKPPTPVSKRRTHRGKTRSSKPLPRDDWLTKEKLLDTRRLDFTFCGIDSCRQIGVVAAKYAIPTWTSKNVKRAKKNLQEQMRGQLVAKSLMNPSGSGTGMATKLAMPTIGGGGGGGGGPSPGEQQQEPRSPRWQQDTDGGGHAPAPPGSTATTKVKSGALQTARDRGTGGKTARSGRTRRIRAAAAAAEEEISEPNCMYDTFGWLTTRQRKAAKEGGARGRHAGGGQRNSNAARHALVDSITLANNELQSLAHFQESIKPFLALHTTNMLTHLDLSCNRLTSLYIAPEGAALAAFLKEKNSSDPNRSGSPAAPSRVSALASMPNLHTLYLHVNALRDHHELDAIAGLKVLRNLSLHGNPLEENFASSSGGGSGSALPPPNGAAPNAATAASGYRLSVIAKIPWLRELDFVTITKGERFEIATEANKLSARSLRRRQKMLERPHPPRDASPGSAEANYSSSTHKLVHTLQRIHVSTAAGEQPEKIVAKSVIDTGRNQ